MASLATARNHGRRGMQGARVIAGLYEAIASTAHTAGEYERWLRAAEYLAGPLERKRAADRGALERRHGIEIAAGSIGPLLLAIETYLAVRALTYAYQAATEIRRLDP